MRFLIFYIVFGVLLTNIAFAEPNTKSGETLYQQLCAACHSPLEQTDVPNRPYPRIASAIRVFPAMQQLKGLEPEQIHQIALALKQTD